MRCPAHILWLVAVAAGCGSTETTTPPKKPARPLRPGPSDATCDPSLCAAFCDRTACDSPRDACLARCQAVCGDGYFDDRDGPLIECNLVTRKAEDGCSAARECCKADYTSQLCNLSPSLPIAPPAKTIDAGSEIEDKRPPEHL